MSRRIYIDEYPFSPEVRKFLVTMIAQKQRLASIADEHNRVARNFNLAHASSMSWGI
jgi:hypothetical protein